MIIYENKGFETRSDMPNQDWTGKALYVVEDGSPLAAKILELCPYYNFVTDQKGKLIDVTPISRPEPEPISNAEMRAKARAEMRYKENDYPLISWEGEAMTLDEASLRYSQYLARESTKAEALKLLIIAADEYIRELYPDEKAEMEVADGN